MKPNSPCQLNLFRRDCFGWWYELVGSQSRFLVMCCILKEPTNPLPEHRWCERSTPSALINAVLLAPSTAWVCTTPLSGYGIGWWIESHRQPPLKRPTDTMVRYEFSVVECNRVISAILVIPNAEATTGKPSIEGHATHPRRRRG